MLEDKIKERIEELLKTPYSSHDVERSTEVFHGALNLLTMLYGADSPQVKALNDGAKQIDPANRSIALSTAYAARGSLRNLLGDLQLGLVRNLEREIAGGVLSDFLSAASAALNEKTETGKNIAAVLVAATFEDTLRRMASTLCGISTRPALQEIVIALKDKGVLKGPQVGVVQAHLKFRNDALHANWADIDTGTVTNAIGLVQNLLLTHFK